MFKETNFFCWECCYERKGSNFICRECFNERKEDYQERKDKCTIKKDASFDKCNASLLFPNIQINLSEN